jgi:hypothetical protein
MSLKSYRLHSTAIFRDGSSGVTHTTLSAGSPLPALQLPLPYSTHHLIPFAHRYIIPLQKKKNPFQTSALAHSFVPLVHFTKSACFHSQLFTIHKRQN